MIWSGISTMLGKLKAKLGLASTTARMSSVDENTAQVLLWLVAQKVVYLENWDDVEKYGWEGYKPYILLNDVFGVASSDYELFNPSELPLLAKVYRQFEFSGLIAWAAYKRKKTPLKEWQTHKYHKAMTFLESEK